jgi:hypothetical protein
MMAGSDPLAVTAKLPARTAVVADGRGHIVVAAPYVW